jgi:hypothetical protein
MTVFRASLIVAIAATIGCEVFSTGDAFNRRRIRPIDGLERIEISLPGVLEVREDHRIGSYDAFLIPAASLSYNRGSVPLTPPAKRAFLKLLRESMIAASEAAAIPVQQEPGPCVMAIELRVSGLNLEGADRADQLVELTLVMQFRDSVSGMPLLRYATENQVPNPMDGVTQDQQIRKGLRRIVADMNIAGAFRATGYADDRINPGCNGTLAARGREAAQQR